MFICNCGSGLGNRIKSLVSCLRLDKNSKINWKKAPGILDCEFEDLFLNDLTISSPFPKNSRVYSSWRLAVLPEDNVPPGFAKVTFGKDLIGRPFSFTDPQGRNIDLEYNRIPESIKKEYVRCFQSFKINPTVLSWIAETEKLFDEETVSVHIRSWEDQEPDEESISRQKNFFKLEKFTNEMKKFPEETKFYLSSDAVSVIEKVKKIFPGRIITHKRHSELMTSRSTRTGAQDDLAELLLLSKNKVIIGTYLSTFTETAWWFGGAYAQVVIV